MTSPGYQIEQHPERAIERRRREYPTDPDAPIAGALPPPHVYPQRVKPKLDGVMAFIDAVLDEDRRAPRKQRHTARRIHRRILREFPGASVAESTVRNHVRERKREIGLVLRETFVPQSYTWGQEAQVDWYEAWADLGDERTKLQVFAMRAMASGAAFHRAYLHAMWIGVVEEPYRRRGPARKSLANLASNSGPPRRSRGPARRRST